MISIMGSGRIGSTIAFLAAVSSLDDVSLINRNKDIAVGQALDISNAALGEFPISVVGTDYSAIKKSDVIVITASVGVLTTSRTDLLLEHSSMIRDIAKTITKYASPDAKILMVTSPVDALTYVFQKEAGWPRKHVMGVASSLDSNRLRYLIAKELDTKQAEISDGFVLGEHGDSMVPIFSIAKWNNKPVLGFLNENQVQKITEDLRGYWKILRSFKGPSIFGIAKNTYDIIKAIVKDEEFFVPVSVLLEGEYGLSDVCLGVPVRINQKGIMNIVEIDLAQKELESLHKSADVIKNYLKECEVVIQK